MGYRSSFSNFLKPSYFNYFFIEIVIAILVSVAFIIWSYLYQNQSNEIRRTLINYFSPIVNIVSLPAGQMKLFFEKIDYFFEIDERNNKLDKEIINYKQQLNEMYALKVENYNLRNLLNLKAPPASKKITARIIIDPSSFALSNIFIDVGEEDNVKLNNPVFNENGMLGRIINVNKNTSEVLLITDAKSNLPVLSAQTNLKFFVQGNSNHLKIKHLEEIRRLIDNELVLTTSVSGYFKEGIIVGSIAKNSEEIFIIPSAKKSDSVFVKVLVYDYEKEHPNFEER